MLLIVAGQADEWAARRAIEWQATLMTPRDLSRSGWRYSLPDDGGAAAAIGDRIVEARDITAVLVLVAWITPDDLPEVAKEDRAYVSSELNAFLVAWFNALPCRVLNRPTPSCLCGPIDRLPFVSDEGADAEAVVMGGRCLPGADHALAEQALELARNGGVEFLDVRFRAGSFIHARLMPDLSRDDLAAELYRFLSSAPLAAPVRPHRPNVASRRGPVLLWGLPADRPLDRVHQELERIGASVVLLNQRDVLNMEVADGEVRVQGNPICLDAVQSVYPRSYDSTALPHLKNASPTERDHAARIDAHIASWIGTASAFIVSPLDAMSANNSKPYQSRWIAQFGWRIPRTLITTDPAAARAFRALHGEVVYKSISGTRSVVSRLTDEHETRMENVVNCPTQFQEYIRGTDYRVHVVGEEAFSCQVESDADDYRYPGGGESEFIACTLPKEVEERCIRMSKAMNLPLSGVDLRQTPDGQWVCFEVNPSPGFTSYEDETGQAIGAAIARLLWNPPMS